MCAINELLENLRLGEYRKYAPLKFQKHTGKKGDNGAAKLQYGD